MAFLVSAKSLYFPVPTNSRDENSRPAMINRSFCMDDTPSSTVNIRRRTAADKTQNFHSISLFQTPLVKLLAIEDFQIQLHRHTFGLDGEFTQQVPHRRTSLTAPLLAVHLNLNCLRHRHLSSGSRIPKVNEAGPACPLPPSP